MFLQFPLEMFRFVLHFFVNENFIDFATKKKNVNFTAITTNITKNITFLTTKLN